MEIGKNKVVNMDYTLKDENGKVIDTSEGRDTFSFIYGTGAVIPGLEKALKGKSKGEEFSVSIEPEDGYGEYNEKAIFTVSKEKFQGNPELKEDMQVQAQTQNGEIRQFSVSKIHDDTVVLDANHPLAGKTLNFDIEVVDVRDATREELDNK